MKCPLSAKPGSTAAGSCAGLNAAWATASSVTFRSVPAMTNSPSAKAIAVLGDAEDMLGQEIAHEMRSLR